MSLLLLADTSFEWLPSGVSSLYKAHTRSAGSNNTLLTTGPMGFQFKPDQTWKWNRKDVSLSPEGPSLSLPLSPSLSLSLSLSHSLGYLYASPHWPLSSNSQSWGNTQHTGVETHTERQKFKKSTQRKGRSTYKRETHTHAHTDTDRYIYRHSRPYFRMLSAGGQRLEETQDEFSSASFHHTAMTPLFTSPIYLHTDCLPPCLARVCICYCACVHA